MPLAPVEDAVAWYAANVNTGQKTPPDEKATINELRARLIKAQGDGEELKNKLREFEVRAAEENLVPAAAADQVIETAVGPMLRALEGMDSQLKVKCNPSDPELAGHALREWSIKLRKQCVAALERLAKKLESPPSASKAA